ncbi:recombinase family protein [Heliorestis convoluta]|uniref:Recombinase family protein n=1 Tax=Heliorestis convoluta TaxID=356322 RepID=A0A5Q2N1E1_9FIRM|nr:recombinase family protein [Heliorestis convoluta]QGG46365.1 recombinase family protein [Heliorestis convoluta]
MDKQKFELVDPKRNYKNIEEMPHSKDTLNQKGIAIGGYVRVSTQKEGQKSSVENQQKYLTEWADVHGYRLLKMYIDTKSGEYISYRNELQEMIQDIRAGKIRGIVTKEIARSSRDVMDILELKRTLSDYGGFMISIRENYDSRTDDDEFLLVIHAAMAQKERKTTSSRIKVTQILKAKEGKGNIKPPFGYRYSETEKGKYEPDPVTGPIYKEIISQFLSGQGRDKIARWLNSKGIKTSRGGIWRESAIKVLLENPAYLGFMVYNTTTLLRTATGQRKRVRRPMEEWVIVEDAHPALITQEEWDKVHEIMLSRRKIDNRRRISFERKYLLSTLLRCGICKGNMYGVENRSKHKRKSKNGEEVTYYYYRYVCQGRNGRCDAKVKVYEMERVDKEVFKQIKAKVIMLTNPSEVVQYVQSRKDIFTDGLEKERRKREELQVRINKNEKAIKRQQEAYEAEVIELEEYRIRVTELRKEKDDLLLTLDTLNRKLAEVDSAHETILKLAELMVAYVSTLDDLSQERKHELLRLMVQEVYLYPDYKIEIKWSFEP